MKIMRTDDSTDWAALPKDLLVSIVDHLTPEEQVRFAMVCISWGQAFMAGGWSRPPPQTPWLLLSQPLDEENRKNLVKELDNNRNNNLLCFDRPFDLNFKRVKFYDIDGWIHRLIRVACPILSEWRVLGISLDGWLFLLDPKPQIWAINPISRREILLPPLPPDIFYDLHPWECIHDHSPLVAMSSPWDDMGHLIFAISYVLPHNKKHHVLALARQGASEWSVVNIQHHPCQIMSLIYNKGHFFVLLKEDEDVSIFSVRACHPPLESHELIRLGEMSKEIIESCSPSLIVSTSGDELFLGYMIKKRGYGYSPRCFRLDIGDGGAVLANLCSLDTNALLLGRGGSFMIPGDVGFPALEGNCVYWNHASGEEVIKFANDNQTLEVHSHNRGCFCWFFPGVL